MDRTLVICKPDAVERGLAGQIVARLEAKGLRLAAAELRTIDAETAGQHYGEHKGKPFYEGLVEYITSSPSVLMVLEGSDAIAITRNTMGATKPAEATPGTIRADFGMEIGRNLVHGSDSPESAQREIGIFFGDGGIVDYDRAIDTWVPGPRLPQPVDHATAVNHGGEAVVIGGFLAISSKYVLRYRGSHLWNPTNFAIANPMGSTSCSYRTRAARVRRALTM